MARFSVGGDGDADADEGGSSSQVRKKLRIETLPVPQPQEELHDEDSSSSEEDESSSEEGTDEYEEEEEDPVGVPNQTPTSEPLSSSAPASSGSNANARIFLTLTDPEVLDCPICYDSLTIPVFQCENGHIACTSCCKKISHKCPSCLLPIGYNRCRAIEKVLESVKLPCQNLRYGCREMVNYSKKFEHEKICNHAPYSCPLSSCKFVGSCKQLYQHFSSKHKGSAVHFRFNATTPLFFTLNDKSLFLQEEKGVIFVLNNREESIGNVVTINSLAPPSHKDGYFYELTAISEGSNLRFQSFTKNIRKFDNDDFHSEEFLMVPRSFFGSYGQISLDLHVREHGQLGRVVTPAGSIQSTTVASRISNPRIIFSTVGNT